MALDIISPAAPWVKQYISKYKAVSYLVPRIELTVLILFKHSISCRPYTTLT
jgi:hypothetical protein